MKKFVVLMGLIISTVFAAVLLTNQQLPSLSGLSQLSEIDTQNAQTIIEDPLDETMEITASDINAKFAALKVIADNIPVGVSISSCADLSTSTDVFGQAALGLNSACGKTIVYNL